jgi:hypothetical protein
MVNAISSNISHIHEAPKPDTPKPQPEQKSAPQPSNTVTLKSTGTIDNR